MHVKIAPAQREDVGAVASDMREADRLEVAASSGRTPWLALHRAFVLSHDSWTVLADGQPVAMFGVGKKDRNGNACAWLLGTPWMDQPAAARHIWRHSVEWIEKLHKHSDALFNWIDARNTRSLRWLRRLGFRPAFEEPEYGVAKIPFTLMISERRNV